MRSKKIRNIFMGSFIAAMISSSFILSSCDGLHDLIPLSCISQKNPAEADVTSTPIYLASDHIDVALYQYINKTDENNNETEIFDVVSHLARGTSAYSLNSFININTEDEPDEYLKIKLTDSDDAESFYIKPENAVTDPASIVKETEKFVRTSATIYKNVSGAEIASFIKKGEKIDITGFDKIDASGNVNKYKIKVPGSDDEGYIYSKYLTDSKESADQVYQKIYDIHENRIYEDFELYGGLPSTLDWYPYEKPSFEGNILVKDAKTMYLNADAAVNNEAYLKLIADTNIDAVVIDIKDGRLAFDSDVAKELSPTSYDNSFVSKEEYKNAVQAFKDEGVYVIGRIVCFNDEFYAADHPETCIESPESTKNWPSAYSRDAWYYNTALALESIELCGFNEIQFDYIRFPENAYGMSKNPDTDYKNEYNEEKAEAVQNFCFYAADVIHEAGAYFSVDVFGECADEYVSAYGQYWPAISNIVDVISGMPYTDHYGGEEDTWTNPYDIVYKFAERAAKRQNEIETPATVRTWITGYDTPNWDPNIDYDEDKMTEQINALYDAGLKGGFIPWHGASSIEKYNEYANIWNKNYPAEIADEE